MTDWASPESAPRYEATALNDDWRGNDARQRMLFQRWLGAKPKNGAGPASLPPKSCIDPVALRSVLGWLFLYDIVRSPLRFRYRIYASAIAARTGFDHTGKWVDELPDPVARDIVIRSLTLITGTGRPHLVRFDRTIRGERLYSEALVLPLAGPDGAVGHIAALMSLPADTPRERAFG